MPSPSALPDGLDADIRGAIYNLDTALAHLAVERNETAEQNVRDARAVLVALIESAGGILY